MGAFIERLIYGKLKISVHGLNLDKFLSKMQEKGIVFHDLEKMENKLTFCVGFSDYKIIKRYAIASKLNVQIIKQKNFKSLLMNFAKHAGIIIAVVFWLIVGILFQNNYRSVTISTNDESYNSADVRKFVLANMGSASSLRELEREVVVNFNEVNACTITRSGTKIMVKLYVDEIKPEAFNILAPCDCVVLDIKVTSGEQVASVGQVVKKGSSLVKTKTLSSGQVEPAIAKISVSGWVSANEIFNGNKTVFERTGRTVKSAILDIFGIKFGTFSQKVFRFCDFSENEVYIAYNNFLPIKRIERTYFELEERVVNVKFSDEEENIRQHAFETASDLIPEGAVNLVSTFTTIEGDDGIIVSCYIKFELNIG